MSDLVAFLAARLDEDEAAAKGPPGWRLEHWHIVKYADNLSGRNWRVDADPRNVVDAVAREDAEFIARHDPARVLREVDAKRKIIAEHTQARVQPSYCDTCSIEFEWPCPTVRALAAVYADHPDYDPAWGQ